MSDVLYTVGHSTRSLEELIEILKAHGVRAVADVRQVPRSRRFPHFDESALTASLPAAGITYRGFKSLGGRRRPRPDSANMAWRNEAFRGYADFMGTEAFEQALAELVRIARERPTAIMCAEAVPWRCHRSLIADVLVARGWTALDLLDASTARRHELPAFARVEGERIRYPGPGTTGELHFDTASRSSAKRRDRSSSE